MTENKRYFSEKKISSSKSMKTFQNGMGIAMMIIGGLMLLGYVGSPSDFNVVDLLLYLVIAVGGVILFGFGKRRGRLLNNAEKYEKYLEAKEQIDLNDLSAKMGKSLEVIIKDLEELIEKKYLNDVFVDHDVKVLKSVRADLKSEIDNKIEIKKNQCKNEKVNVDLKSKDQTEKKSGNTVSVKSSIKTVSEYANNKKLEQEKELAQLEGKEKFKKLVEQKIEKNKRRVIVSIISTLVFFVIGITADPIFWLFALISVVLCVVFVVRIETYESEAANSCNKCYGWNSMELIDEVLIDRQEETVTRMKEVAEKSVTTYTNKWGVPYSKDLRSETITYKKVPVTENVTWLVYERTYKCKVCGEVVITNKFYKFDYRNVEE